MSKKRLLIINKAQFGYHIDSYKYCQFLKDEFDITYICFDIGKEQIEENGVEILYVPYTGSYFQKGIGYIWYCRNHILKYHFDMIFVDYFQMASLLRLLLPSKKFILDIRSGSINLDTKKRIRYDSIMKFESRFFRNVTIISDCLRKKMRLKQEKTHILPLGADALSNTDKSFEKLRLLYVGTLDSRNLHETVLGLSDFIEKQGIAQIDITYDIFGSGTEETENILLKTITDAGLGRIVKFHGRKMHNELRSYFDECNIGISFVPITDYFQCQPPTKTFEYINAGLVCIGTSTYENKRLIRKVNGVLCNDEYRSFSRALNEVYINRARFDSQQIRETLADMSWKNIIMNNLGTYVNKKILE